MKENLEVVDDPIYPNSTENIKYNYKDNWYR